MTDAELDALMGRVAAAKKCHDDWVREDGITVVNEGLMPLLVAAITTLRAQLAAETDRANRAEVERAAQIEEDAGMETCGDCMGSGYGGHPDSGRFCDACLGLGAVFHAPATQPHSRTALDAAIRAAKVDAWKEAAELMELAAENCRKQYTYPPKTKEQRDYMTAAIVHGYAASAILALIGDGV